MITITCEKPDRSKVESRDGAAARLYAAELAFRDARHSGVDEWTRVAGNRLHLAVQAFLVADAG